MSLVSLPLLICEPDACVPLSPCPAYPFGALRSFLSGSTGSRCLGSGSHTAAGSLIYCRPPPSP